MAIRRRKGEEKEGRMRSKNGETEKIKEREREERVT